MASDKESRVLQAAAAVFLRYGYRRTTMGDLAEAAGMSRPALYLLFCNKERIFVAVCRAFAATLVDEIRDAAAGAGSVRDKLRMAFELWTVRPFLLMQDSPDARDLLSCDLAFARDAIDQGYQAFEAELAAILQSEPRPPEVPRPAPSQVAHILTAAARGFKASARSAEELRGMIDGLLAIALGNPVLP